jgi:hypothetical protein
MMACRIVSRDRLRRCSHEVLPCVAVRGDFWNAAVPKSVLLKVAFGSRAEDSAAAGHRSFTPTYGRSSAPLAPQPSAKSGLLHPPPSLVDPQGPRSLCKIAICGTRESAFDSTVDVPKHSPLWTVVGKEFPHPVGHHNVMNGFPRSSLSSPLFAPLRNKGTIICRCCSIA